MEAVLLPTRAYGRYCPRMMPTVPSAAEFSLAAPTKFDIAASQGLNPTDDIIMTV